MLYGLDLMILARSVPSPLWLWLSLGLDKLCWHNFENNRFPKALENYAGIIGINIQTCENNRL